MFLFTNIIHQNFVLKLFQEKIFPFDVPYPTVMIRNTEYEFRLMDKVRFGERRKVS